jgi:hypothetical protein
MSRICSPRRTFIATWTFPENYQLLWHEPRFPMVFGQGLIHQSALNRFASSLDCGELEDSESKAY